MLFRAGAGGGGGGGIDGSIYVSFLGGYSIYFFTILFYWPTHTLNSANECIFFDPHYSH